MQSLRKGDEGEAVRRLQQRLTTLGFYKLPVDGDFGPATCQAVQDFQASQHIEVDGVVGRQTLGLLGIDLSYHPIPAGPETLDVPMVQRICHDSPPDNIGFHWPRVRQAMEQQQLGDNSMLLMAVATIYVETGIFAPLDEYPSKFNTTATGHPFDKYDDRVSLGNRGYPDGARYKGRGYIQLTGRANYRNIGEKMGLGHKLEDDPELANNPDIAAAILSTFLKRAEQPIRLALQQKNLARARRLINGGSHGLPEFSRCYNLGCQLLNI